MPKNFSKKQTLTEKNLKLPLKIQQFVVSRKTDHSVCHRVRFFQSARKGG